MEDMLLKFGAQSGPVVAVVALLAFVAVKYLVPAAREALAAHQGDIRAMIDDHRTAQRELVAAFERRHDKIVDSLSGELRELDGRVDRMAVAVEGIRAELSRGNTAPLPKIDAKDLPQPAKPV